MLRERRFGHPMGGSELLPFCLCGFMSSFFKHLLRCGLSLWHPAPRIEKRRSRDGWAWKPIKTRAGPIERNKKFIAANCVPWDQRQHSKGCNLWLFALSSYLKTRVWMNISLRHVSCRHFFWYADSGCAPAWTMLKLTAAAPVVHPVVSEVSHRHRPQCLLNPLRSLRPSRPGIPK